MRHLLLAPLINWARQLKYPTLFKLVAGLFLVSVLIPDPIPFLDELLLGLSTLLLAKWKDRDAEKTDRPPPIEGQATRR